MKLFLATLTVGVIAHMILSVSMRQEIRRLEGKITSLHGIIDTINLTDERQNNSIRNIHNTLSFESERWGLVAKKALLNEPIVNTITVTGSDPSAPIPVSVTIQTHTDGRVTWKRP